MSKCIGEITAYSTVPTTEIQSPDRDDDRVADAAETSYSVVAQDALLIPTTYTDQQITDCYPGVAFCKFLPGIIETIIRLSLMVVLMILTVLSLSNVYEPTIYLMNLCIALGIAPVGLAKEGIMILLHVLNPQCFNNRYKIFGAMDMIGCVVVGSCMFYSYMGTVQEIRLTSEHFKKDCEGSGHEYPFFPNDCDELQTARDLNIAITVFGALSIVLFFILFIWDAVYLSFNYKSKVPVPRSRSGQHH